MLINNPGSVEDVIHRVNRGMDGIRMIIITFKHHNYYYIVISFTIIPENNQGTNKLKKNSNCFKTLEHVSIDIQSIIVNHLTI